MATIREIIKDIQNEVGGKELLPDRAAELLNQLAALLGNINQEIRQRDFEYSTVLLSYLQSEQKATHAKIKAECSLEFLAKREARDTKELALEMIRSLKYYLQAKRDELQTTKYQK